MAPLSPATQVSEQKAFVRHLAPPLYPWTHIPYHPAGAVPDCPALCPDFTPVHLGLALVADHFPVCSTYLPHPFLPAGLESKCRRQEHQNSHCILLKEAENE